MKYVYLCLYHFYAVFIIMVEKEELTQHISSLKTIDDQKNTRNVLIKKRKKKKIDIIISLKPTFWEKRRKKGYLLAVLDRTDVNRSREGIGSTIMLFCISAIYLIIITAVPFRLSFFRPPVLLRCSSFSSSSSSPSRIFYFILVSKDSTVSIIPTLPLKGQLPQF
jgi:hypothetical protein